MYVLHAWKVQIEFNSLLSLIINDKVLFFMFAAIPFIKNPEQNAAFDMYFQRAWQDTFFLSLYNFLITLFHHMHILYL